MKKATAKNLLIVLLILAIVLSIGLSIAMMLNGESANNNVKVTNPKPQSDNNVFPKKVGGIRIKLPPVSIRKNIL